MEVNRVLSENSGGVKPSETFSTLGVSEKAFQGGQSYRIGGGQTFRNMYPRKQNEN